MTVGTRIRWRGRAGTFVGPRPKGMADIKFDDVDFVERRPQGELMRSNPGLDSSDWSEWAKTDFTNFGYVVENPKRVPAWRKKLRKSQFAIPERRAWPIHDAKHARIALQYMFDRGFGKKSEYRRIVYALLERWPQTKYPKVWKGYLAKANRLVAVKVPKTTYAGANKRRDGSVLALVANPPTRKPAPKKARPYDPSEEQFHAQVQAIYESQVKKELGKKSTAPFKSPRGVRLDTAALKAGTLTRTDLRRLLKSAFVIATKVGQKHGWLEPKTQKATTKGRMRSMERYLDEGKRKANRKDYEQTLALVRKSNESRTTVERNVWGKTVTRTYPGRKRNPGEELEALSDVQVASATNLGLLATGNLAGLLVSVLVEFGFEYLKVVARLPAAERRAKIEAILRSNPNTALHVRALQRVSPKAYADLIDRISTTLGSASVRSALNLGDVPWVQNALMQAVG